MTKWTCTDFSIKPQTRLNWLWRDAVKADRRQAQNQWYGENGERKRHERLGTWVETHGRETVQIVDG